MTVTVQGANVSIESFPAGEKKITVHSFGSRREVTIGLHWSGDNGDIFTVALVADALRRSSPRNERLLVNLILPYIPYQQQDRVASAGEGLSIKVLSTFINSLNFNKVYVNDAHSYVATALLDNVVEYDLLESMRSVVPSWIGKACVLVAPDAGAMKKVAKAANHYGSDMITASKVRDPKTGALSDIDVNSSTFIGNKSFLIVDDLAVAGGTFIGVAKRLRKLTDGKIYLYVTHGIFSKGYEELAKYIDGIYTANLIGDNDPLIINFDRI